MKFKQILTLSVPSPFLSNFYHLQKIGCDLAKIAQNNMTTYKMEDEFHTNFFS